MHHRNKMFVDRSGHKSKESCYIIHLFMIVQDQRGMMMGFEYHFQMYVYELFIRQGKLDTTAKTLCWDKKLKRCLEGMQYRK